MMKVFHLPVVLGFAFVSSLSYSQTNLATYLADLKWDVSKSGSLLAIQSEQVFATSKRAGLAAFGRKLMKVGDLSAIVPETMVNIDDSLSKAPDFYDGLPRKSKVLYLLSLLNQSQMKKAAGKGIGLNDLFGEQRNVFQSLMPRTLRWSTIKIDSDGIPGDPTDAKTLSGDSVRQVKIRILRQLMLIPTSKAQPRSFFYMDIGGAGQTSGAVVKIRDESENATDGMLFGVQIRQVVENKSKASDIAYRESGWDTLVSTNGLLTIGDFVQRINNATGRSIKSDPHVSGLPVSFVGNAARAGDLLESLALGVSGTFRKVGQSYLLTSDLKGAGARQLRLAAWAMSCQEEAKRREQTTSGSLRQSGFMKMVGFDMDNPFAPSDTMRGQILAEEGSNQRKNMSVSELPMAIRKELENTTKLMNPPRVFDEVGLSTNFKYAFVLPNGDSLEPERDILATTDSIYKEPLTGPTTLITAKATPPFKVLNPTLKPVMLRAENVAAATTAVELAKSYGFIEVWLETNNRAALQAGIRKATELGMKVSLVVRPWSFVPGVKELDVNLIGQTRRQAWSKSGEAISGDFENSGTDIFSPLDSAVANRWRAIVLLANTPGLVRVAVLDTLPPGYEPEVESRAVRTSQGISEIVNRTGYALTMREAFLRSTSVDPIDLPDANLRFGIDLRQPFFADSRLASTSTDTRVNVKGEVDYSPKWRDFRSEANTVAVKALLGSLADARVPCIVQARKTTNAPSRLGSVREFNWTHLWKQGMDLPTVDSVRPADSVGVLALPGPITLESKDRWIGLRLEQALRSPTDRIAIDLTSLEPDRLKQFFEKWFAYPNL